MKSEQEIRNKIKELKEFKEKYLVSPHDRDRINEYDQSIHDLKWVLNECNCIEGEKQ